MIDMQETMYGLSIVRLDIHSFMAFGSICRLGLGRPEL